MTIVTVGIYLVKTLCRLAGWEGKGRLGLRKRIQRDRLLAFTASLPSRSVALEACFGAHHLG